jgi:hypothetical protein
MTQRITVEILDRKLGTGVAVKVPTSIPGSVKASPTKSDARYQGMDAEKASPCK